MEEIIIDYTKNIDNNILDQVASLSPWEGLKYQLTIDMVTDEWVSFVKGNISCILLNEGEVISYGAFGIDNKFGKNIIINSGLDIKETFLGIYLFTNEKYRGKGYANSLKNEQLKYIENNFPNIKYLLGETEKIKTLELYKKYGAIQIAPSEKQFFKNIFSYYYETKKED